MENQLVGGVEFQKALTNFFLLPVVYQGIW